MMVLVSTGDVGRACACVRLCARVCCVKETVNAWTIGGLLVNGIGEEALLMFRLNRTTSGTHHPVVPALMSRQAAQLHFT